MEKDENLDSILDSFLSDNSTKDVTNANEYFKSYSTDQLEKIASGNSQLAVKPSKDLAKQFILYDLAFGKDRKDTLLNMLLQQKNPSESTKKLIKKIIKIGGKYIANNQNKDGKTPIFCTIDKDIVPLLQDQGVDVYNSTYKDDIPLIYHIKNYQLGFENIIDYLFIGAKNTKDEKFVEQLDKALGKIIKSNPDAYKALQGKLKTALGSSLDSGYISESDIKKLIEKIIEDDILLGNGVDSRYLEQVRKKLDASPIIMNLLKDLMKSQLDGEGQEIFSKYYDSKQYDEKVKKVNSAVKPISSAALISSLFVLITLVLIVGAICFASAKSGAPRPTTYYKPQTTIIVIGKSDSKEANIIAAIIAAIAFLALFGVGFFKIVQDRKTSPLKFAALIASTVVAAISGTVLAASVVVGDQAQLGLKKNEEKYKSKIKDILGKKIKNNTNVKYLPNL